MYVNNSTYIENHKCENCKNESICKWVSLMTTTKGNVDKIIEDKDFSCPINIKITCNNFERKTQKQDGVSIFRATNRDLY